MKDPSLLEKFASIYPEKYVKALQANIQDSGTQNSQQTSNTQGVFTS